jgi:ABC-type branched-subunit amino acid transport system substrate-binding protein
VTLRLPYDSPPGPAAGRSRRRLAAGRSRRRLAAAAALAASAAFAACGPTPAKGALEGPQSSTSLGPVRTVRVGFLGGATSQDGAVEDGTRLAVSQFAGSDEGVSVVVDVASTRGTAAGAAAGARRLVADHVVAVIGPQTTAEIAGAEPVLSAAGIPAITATATDPTVTARGWKGFFRAVAAAGQQGSLIAAEVVQNLGATSVALVGGGTTTERSVLASAATEAGADGATVGLDDADVTAAATSDIVSQVVAAGTAAVVCAVPASLAAQLVTALTVAGYTGVVVLAGQGPPLSMLVAGAGSDQRVYVASPADDAEATAAGGGPALVFEDAYRAAFGSKPPAWSAEAYDATDFVLAAVSAGATDPATVEQYLATGSWVGVASTVSFTADGDQQHAQEFISQIRNGSLVQITSEHT